MTRKMFSFTKIGFSFVLITLIIEVNSYKSTIQNPQYPQPAPLYPNTRRTWDHSDEYWNDSPETYIHPQGRNNFHIEEDGNEEQPAPRSNDRRSNFDPVVSFVVPQNPQQFVPKGNTDSEDPINFFKEMIYEGHDQPSSYHHHNHHHHPEDDFTAPEYHRTDLSTNENKFPLRDISGTELTVRTGNGEENVNIEANRRSDSGRTINMGGDGQFFKVQRNRNGTLNVVFNDTIISQPKKDDRISQRTPPININSNPTISPTRDIVFPDDPKMRRIVPKCRESGKPFCTDVDNYPQDLVLNALRVESRSFQQLFGSDVLIEPNPNISQRIDAPDEESLCMSVEKVIYPKAGLTKDNNWSFIVNQGNYTQGIRVEECINAGKPCSMTNSFPQNYITECRQKFIFRQLVAINPEGVVTKDLFQIPSCCKCILRQQT